MRCAWVRLLVLPLAALAPACGDDGATNMNGPVDMAMAPPPADMAKKPKPDLYNPGMDPVGAACADESMCSGTRPVCRMSLSEFNPPLAAPTGYCSNDKCTDDSDCGTGGLCVNSGFCFAECAGKGECPMTNPGNVCAQVNAMGLKLCIPKAVDACNPTDPMSCEGTGACQRTAIDDAGTCLKTCTLGGACPAGAQGAKQNCYFLNLRVDVNGKATGDAYAGLTCIVEDPNGGAAPGAACMYLNSCQEGYECNFWKQGGADKVCKKLCRNGGNECVLGTCQNAFLLAKFDTGDVGLCL